jgi:glycosyltransferase involved in cell wall biosynthesis
MSSGCAMITTNSSGCCETVGDAGLLIELNDAIDLKQKIKLLIADRQLMSNLQEKAKKRVEEFFGWDAILKEYTQRIKAI